SAPKHDSIFCFYRQFQRAVRTKRHKLIVYPEARVTQLFDLDADPWEMHNLAEEPKYGALRQDLLHRLRELQRELGDSLELGAA
ncbi:MAG: sulfatase/phosphatase domain-containing protein, partial [Bryobacteraceae bacterium]